MTFQKAVAKLCDMAIQGIDLDRRPYMTRGSKRVVVYMRRLYSVRISEWDGKRNVVSEPFSPTTADIFSKDWTVVSCG